MYVTTDALAFSVTVREGVRLLLVRRANAPYDGMWALPGGFVGLDEGLEDACRRELKEETGVEAGPMVQLGAWGAPERDPRGRNVSVVYMTGLRLTETEARAASDAAEVRWHAVDDLPRLAFDHDDIVRAGRRRLRSLVGGTHFGFRMLPEEFGIAELRALLAGVRQDPVTENEARAFLKGCRVVKVAARTPREGDRFRCATANPLQSVGRR
jgi:8-oxo-dGTP diphosphatase